MWCGRLAVRCVGEPKFDLQPSVDAGVDLERRVVGGGDRGDDRQSEADPVVVADPVWGEALEWLQQPIDLVCGYGGSRVGDLERGLAGYGLDPQAHPPVLAVVTQRILQQVRYQALH